MGGRYKPPFKYLFGGNMFWNKERKKLIDYAEQEAKILASFQIECADAVERASNTLLNILLSGAGGGLALAISLYERGAEDWVLIGTFATSIYLFILCGILVRFCLWSSEISPTANEPNHIYNENTRSLELVLVKYYELKNRQQSIEYNRTRNENVGAWLNTVRSMAALTPLIIVISLLIS